MKKYVSFILLLFCSCAFVYHGEGKDEEWTNAYKISRENIEKKAWDKIKLDGQYFAVFKKNYFEKEGFKSKKNSVVILSSMYNFPSDSEEKINYDEKHGNTINSIPCIIIVNNIEINTANNKDFKERISKLNIVAEDKNNYIFLGYIKPFKLKKDMFYKLDANFLRTYNEHKKLINDKGFKFTSSNLKNKEELDKLLKERGHEIKDRSTLLNIYIVKSVIDQSEKYYQLGYKYPCFECSL